MLQQQPVHHPITQPAPTKLYLSIWIFMAVYPFLIFPFTDIYYSTSIKLFYLSIFTFVVWLFIVLALLREKSNAPAYMGPNPRTLRKTLLKSSGEKLLLLYLSLALVATAFSVDPYVSFFGSVDKLHGWLAWFCFISMFFFAYHLIPAGKTVAIIQTLVYASTLVAIYGILQHFFLEHIPGAGVQAERYTGFVKSWAFFDNPNHFGTYLVIVMLLAMTLYLMAKTTKQWAIYLGINCLLLVPMLYTLSRGSWIALLLGMGLFTLFVVYKQKHLWKRWGILLASYIIIFTTVNVSDSSFYFNRMASVGEDINSVLTDMDDSHRAGSGRWGIWKRSLEVARDNPLLGTGPSTFSLVYFTTEEQRAASSLDNSHNDYIEIAMSMGLPALLVYLAFFVVVLKKSLAAVHHLHGREKILMTGLIIVLVSYLVKVMFNISVVTIAPIFWLLVGLTYAMAAISIESKKDTKAA